MEFYQLEDSSFWSFLTIDFASLSPPLRPLCINLDSAVLN